jgi:hypothetical protein
LINCVRSDCQPHYFGVRSSRPTMLDAPLTLPDVFPQSLSSPVTADYVAAISRHFAASSGSRVAPLSVSATSGRGHDVSPSSSGARQSLSNSPELTARYEDPVLPELLPKRRRSTSDVSLVATGECAPLREPLRRHNLFICGFHVGLNLYCVFDRSSHTCTDKGVKAGRRYADVLGADFPTLAETLIGLVFEVEMTPRRRNRQTSGGSQSNHEASTWLENPVRVPVANGFGGDYQLAT